MNTSSRVAGGSPIPGLALRAEEPLWPTFGLRLIEPDPRAPLGHGIFRTSPRRKALAVIDYLRSLVDTTMAAHDRLYIDRSDFKRTIPIDTLGVRATEFDLTEERAMELFESGRAAATRCFLGVNLADGRASEQAPAQEARTLSGRA